MKKTIFAFSMALASAALGGNTGSEAAGLISSYPGAKSEFEYSGTLNVIGVDDETGEPFGGTIKIGPDTDWYEVEYYTEMYGYSASTAAQTALMALAKAAYLEAKDEFTQGRIDTLTESVQKAVRSLDKIDLVDEVNEIRKTLTKKDKADDGRSGNTYIGGNIFNVAAAQADGKSIASNSQDRLEINGFSDSTTKLLQIPHKGSDKVAWAEIGYWGDGKSIGDKDSGGNYLDAIKIAGWDSPGTAPHGCVESIAAMLTQTASDPALTPEQDSNNHLVLTRFSGDSEPVIHFTKIGSLGAVGGGSAIKFVGTEGEAVVGTGAKTNTVTFSKFSDSNVRIKVEQSGGNATITFGVYYK